MDWGLFLHCAALVVTLGRTLKSGKCHGTLSKHTQVAAGRVGLKKNPNPEPLVAQLSQETQAAFCHSEIRPGTTLIKNIQYPFRVTPSHLQLSVSLAFQIAGKYFIAQDWQLSQDLGKTTSLMFPSLWQLHQIPL